MSGGRLFPYFSFTGGKKNIRVDIRVDIRVQEMSFLFSSLFCAYDSF